MTRLNDTQRELIAPLLPVIKWIAAKYHPDTFDDAIDGAIHAVRTYNPSRGRMESWVKRNAGLYITRRKPGFWRRCVVRGLPKHYARRDASLAAVDIRDEVAWHLRNATPWQRRCMLAILRDEPYRGRMVGIAEYRGALGIQRKRKDGAT